MLSISNPHVSVGDTPILKGLSLDVPAGEAPAVMGQNGARTIHGMIECSRRTV